MNVYLVKYERSFTILKNLCQVKIIEKLELGGYRFVIKNGKDR
jgi:hypothetical protein